MEFHDELFNRLIKLEPDEKLSILSRLYGDMEVADNAIFFAELERLVKEYEQKGETENDGGGRVSGTEYGYWNS